MSDQARAGLSAESESEVLRLTSALCDGVATEADVRRLETLLGDPHAMHRYLAIMDQHAALIWKTRWHASVPLPPDLTADGAAHAPVRGLSASMPTSAAWRVGRRWAPAAAAVVAVAAVVGIAVLRERQDSGDVGRTKSPARVLAVADARWDGARPVRKGDPVVSGPLRLLGGLAQLQFAAGATVVLNGPVDLEIVNGRRVFLRGGRITPFVPPGSDGFTVVSPSGEITDLGTEFSVGVDDDGLTNVYVIDGQVDVATGHARRERPLRMSQGFGAQLATPSAAAPNVTLEPLVIDHFDVDRRGGDAAAVGGQGLRWHDLDARHAARVEGGSLLVPFTTEADANEPVVRLLLDHDFTGMIGHKSVITYKVTLPGSDGPATRRWVALVIDDGWSPGDPDRVPLAHSAAAAAAVMVSPVWQAGVRIRGAALPCGPIFPRSGEAVGPYQIVVSIDDSPDSRRLHGGTTLDVMINGVEFSRGRHIELGKHPRLGLMTFTRRGSDGRGEVRIDDFSFSIGVRD